MTGFRKAVSLSYIRFRPLQCLFPYRVPHMKKESKISRRKKRKKQKGWIANTRPFNHSFMHAFNITNSEQSGVLRAEMMKAQSQGTIFEQSTTCSQILVCLDITCKVLGIVSGTYLVLSKPWLSSHHHHHHHYEAMRSLRTDELFMHLTIPGLAKCLVQRSESMNVCLPID